MVVYVMPLRSKLIGLATGFLIVANWLTRAQQADRVRPFPPASCRSLRRFSPIGQIYRVTRSTMSRWAIKRAPAAGHLSGLPGSTTGRCRVDSSFFGKPFINRGISGEASFQMVLRFKQDVASLNPYALVFLGERATSPETADL
jgi:hypothetical protein